MKIALVYLQSLDGFLAKSHSDDLSWATREDREFYISKTKEIGTMIMGSTTFNNMKGVKGTAFKDRHIVVMTSKPEEYKDYKNDFAKKVEFISGSPLDIVKHLESLGIDCAAVVGGGKVISQFLKNDLVDEMFVTVAPVVFGSGIPAINGDVGEPKVELLDTQKISDNEIVFHYKVIH